MKRLDADEIRAAVAVAREAGWTLRREVTLNPRAKCLCPIGALAIIADPGLAADTVGETFAGVCASLDVPYRHALSFATGFDDEIGPSDIDLDAYVLGQELAKELLP